MSEVKLRDRQFAAQLELSNLYMHRRPRLVVANHHWYYSLKLRRLALGSSGCLGQQSRKCAELSHG